MSDVATYFISLFSNNEGTFFTFFGGFFLPFSNDKKAIAIFSNQKRLEKRMSE